MSRKVSRRWRQSIGGSVRWITNAQWSNDGGHTWEDTLFHSGSVTADATSQVRWACNLTLTAPGGRWGINPLSSQVRIKHGMAWGNTRELLDMGVYKVMTTDRSGLSPKQVTITAESFERYLLEDRYVAPWRAPKEDAKARIRRLITASLRDASIVWDPRVQSRVIPAVVIERERWDAIDGGQQSGSVAKALGARVYCDGSGTFIVAPVPTLDDPVTWEARQGPGGILVNSTENLVNDYVYNQVSVSGESTEEGAVAVGPVVARDRDENSLTYAYRSPYDGGFGKKTFFYTSQLITTEEQAFRTANSLLATKLGLRQTVSFDSIHDPTKEPGDVGLVTNPDGSVERAILDSVTYDLLGGNLQATTRTTQTSLSGDAISLSVDSEESG